MRPLLLPVFCFLLALSSVYAQKQNNIWYFNDGTGLDFNGSQLEVLTDGKMRVISSGAIATAADRATGSLLFYTNGDTVWNRNHQPMPNAKGLWRDMYRGVHIVIVPWPGDSMKYYIVVISDKPPVFPSDYDILYYVVDMRLDSGRGDVVTRSQLPLTKVAEKLCAIPQCGSDGYWLLMQNYGDKSYYAYPITRDGIMAPVVSHVGLPPSSSWGTGSLKPSPDGSMVASVTDYRPQVELFTFDRTTGILSSPVTVIVPEAQGLCFSPDNTKLYVTSRALASRGLHQFDVRQKDSLAIASSHSWITKSNGLMLNDMELGPDGILYCAGGQYMPIVSEPNKSGDECGFWPQGVDLDPPVGGGRLPNLVYPSTGVVPVVSAGADASLCTGDTIQLTSSGDGIYRWSPSTGLSCTDCPQPRAFPKATTTYHLLVTNSSGCSAVDSVTVTVNPLPVADAGRDTILCSGADARLRASGGTSYAWSPAGGLSCTDCPDPVARPQVTTTYAVTVSNASGCSAIDSVKVTVLDLLQANAGADTTICSGESVRLEASDGTAWQWSPSVGLNCTDCRTPIASPLTTTTYHLVVTNAGGCSARDSVTVRVKPLPDVDAGADIALCPGESTALRATGGTAYQWSPADGLSCTDCAEPVASPKATTRYYVSATTAEGCSAIDSVTVTIIDATSVDAGKPQAICTGESIQLQASDGATWQWSPADGLSCTDCRSPMATPSKTTLYTVTVSAAGGCSGSDTVSITVLPLPVITAGEDVELCIGETTQLHASGGMIYRWSPPDGLSCTDCADPVAAPAVTTTYTVTGTSADGCTASDMMTVAVGGGRTVQAHIERNHHLLPGTSTLVPVVLDESISGIDTLLFALNYNRGMLRLRDVETAGAELDGWQQDVLVDTLGGIAVRYAAVGSAQSLGAGTLLSLRFDGYVGDTIASELPFSITLPNQQCESVAASAGRVLLDSICGLSYRMIEIGPNKYVLKSPRPNPFNPSTEIEFSLGLDGPTRLEVLNGAGERVAVLVEEYMQPGGYAVRWDAGAMPSGLYYVRLTSGVWTQIQSMVLVK
jgi:hypothetical protein